LGKYSVFEGGLLDPVDGSTVSCETSMMLVICDNDMIGAVNVGKNTKGITLKWN
jgi:hypothetical protein